MSRPARIGREQARRVLAASDSLYDLGVAVGSLADDPETQPEDLLPALRKPAVIADIAAIALHRKTGWPCDPRGKPVVSHDYWRAVLDYCASQSLRGKAERQSDVSPPEQTELNQRLAGALEKLDPLDRYMIIAPKTISSDEVAAQMGLSPSEARRRYRHVLFLLWQDLWRSWAETEPAGAIAAQTDRAVPSRRR